MAYDKLNNIQLAEDIRTKTNLAENYMGQALSRADELVRRLTECGGCVKVPAPSPTPAPAPAPTPPHEHPSEPSEPVPAPSPPPAPTPAPAPPHEHPMPMPTPPATGWVKGPEQPIPSNFPIEPLLRKASIPPSAAPDVVGAFRFIARMSHFAYDDPIVFPGMPNASHLHQFFGNTKTDAFSTYESLRTTGDSAAPNKLNRSAYWTPALLDGLGNFIVADYSSMYYKERPKTDAYFERIGIVTHPQPDGVRWIRGYAPNGKTTGGPYINCNGRKYPDMPTLLANEDRSKIDRLLFIVGGPHSWDGEHIDSPNHRNHVGDLIWDGNKAIHRLPEGHKFVIPAVNISLAYTVLPTDDLSKWHFSSDPMYGTPNCGSFHADLWDAWDPSIKQEWQDNAIDKMLNCSSGDLGSGRGLDHKNWGTVRAEQRLIPLSSLKRP